MTHFIILVADGALAGSVGASLDILAFAQRCGAPAGRVAWQVASAGPQVTLSGGMALAATPIDQLKMAPDAVLVIPGIGLDAPASQGIAGGFPGGATIDERYAEPHLLWRMQAPDAQAYARLAAAHHAAGGVVAASCSGVLLLGMAGLLDGRRATTHWRLGDFVRRHFGKAQFDENRILQEVAVMLVRYSAAEEISRLGIHLKEYHSLLQTKEPVGKRLDFLCQEMNREINTIGSKSQLVELNLEVVKMKNSLENIREQVRNIE